MSCTAKDLVGAPDSVQKADLLILSRCTILLDELVRVAENIRGKEGAFCRHGRERHETNQNIR